MPERQASPSSPSASPVAAAAAKWTATAPATGAAAAATSATASRVASGTSAARPHGGGFGSDPQRGRPRARRARGDNRPWRRPARTAGRAPAAAPGARAAASLRLSSSMTDFAGKCGLVVGVANKRSIAWAIAQAVAARGARLALTYQGRFEEHVRELATGPRPAAAGPAVRRRRPTRRSRPSSSASTRSSAGSTSWSTEPRSRRRAALESPFSETSRDDFRTTLDISAYSLVALTRGALPLMEKRGGGSVVTLSFLGQRPRVSQLQRDGCGQGGARIDRALSGGGRGPEERARQRGFGRTDQDAGRRAGSRGSRASCTCIPSGRRCAATWTPAKWPKPPRFY